ncbi:glycosyltransferase family 1 protein [Bifidobacterium scaligerum]|uniref:Glycosyltransferase family 1 protein n=1 Tax=Bifidobacterium scaligerum TaxID=2052656 RepID=A0A2M9HPA0_9BIFI|nr:glycosyltransferase family 1 protein [Bifidobacterium scaligerum]PJM78653.1 glycosyltransferase family 1 protein [Bifidobacterium scaligerum]
MQRVLVVGMTANPGGLEAVVMNYYRKLDRSRIQFDFLITTPTMAYESEARALGAHIFSITARRVNPFKFTIELHRFFAEHATDYDILWANLCSLVNIDYLKMAARYSIPKRIVHCHNSRNMNDALRGVLHDMHRRSITRYATDYWSCSDNAAEWFFGKGIRSNPRYRYIPNGVDPSQYQFNEQIRESKRKELGVKDGQILIGNIGRLHTQKNQSFLLKAFAALSNRDARYRLIIVGDGDLRPSLEQEINDLGLQASVQLLGVRHDMADLYNAMDIFVLPSLFEGVSIALLEAQSNGLPCLISDTLSDEGIVNDNIRKVSIENIDGWRTVIPQTGITRVSINKMLGSDFDINKQVSSFMQDLLD